MRGKSLLFLILAFLPFLLANATIDTEEELRKEVEKITPIEQKILEELFIQKQEILNIEREIESLTALIDEGETEKERLVHDLEEVNRDFKNKKSRLSKVLLGFQKRGGANIFQLLLDSEGVGELLFRINILREFSIGTGDLLNELEAREREIEAQKKEIEEVLSDIKTRKSLSDDKRKELRAAIIANEEKLQSLKGERRAYEDKILELETRLNELDETLKLFTEVFNELLRNGYFPDEMMNIKISIKGVSGNLKDSELNEFLKKFEVPEVELIFLDDDKIKINSKEYSLELIGTFQVIDGTKLAFIGEEGSFYNLTLTKDTIKDLHDKGYLVFEFKPLIGDYKMKNINTRDGEMSIFMKLF